MDAKEYDETAEQTGREGGIWQDGAPAARLAGQGYTADSAGPMQPGRRRAVTDRGCRVATRGRRRGDADVSVTIGVVGDSDVGTGPPGRILLSVEVADVDGLLQRVEALGGQVSGQPNDMPWGQRVAHIADPDGNSVDLTPGDPGAGRRKPAVNDIDIRAAIAAQRCELAAVLAGLTRQQWAHRRCALAGGCGKSWLT